MLEARTQIDSCWIDLDIPALIEDFIRAQIDPGYNTKGQIDVGSTINAQLDPTGGSANAQLDPTGGTANAQIDVGYTTSAQLQPDCTIGGQIDIGTQIDIGEATDTQIDVGYTAGTWIGPLLYDGGHVDAR
jgi:hypothetical protein